MDVQLIIVVPAGIHARAEALGRRLGLTRSALYSEAVADFLDLHGESAADDEPGAGSPADTPTAGGEGAPTAAG